MRLIRQLVISAGLAIILGSSGTVRADGTNAAPDFKEVYDLIRSHLAGESDAELNHAAVQGLLNELHAKVSLVSGKSATNQPEDAPLLSRTNVYDGSIGYLRVGKVEAGLAGKINSAWVQLSGTNHLKGIVLDLRFADGHDYAEAAAVADIFISGETPLMDWGHGLVRSRENKDAITLPLAVLVNQRTEGGAEALAAVLRQSARAMILGARTAGAATVGKDFSLKNGQVLRIATAAVKLADGEALSANGLKPDIEVAVKLDNEKAWFEDPFKEMATPASLFTRLNAGTTTNGTNRPRRTTEADLMRLRKERPGLELEYGLPSDLKDTEPEKPVIRDPVLARALDLVKGISAIRHAQSP